jgi:hypothetical protein
MKVASNKNALYSLVKIKCSGETHLEKLNNVFLLFLLPILKRYRIFFCWNLDLVDDMSYSGVGECFTILAISGLYSIERIESKRA